LLEYDFLQAGCLDTVIIVVAHLNIVTVWHTDADAVVGVIQRPNMSVLLVCLCHSVNNCSTLWNTCMRHVFDLH